MVLNFPKITAGLYLVATPIGTASDISLRALHLLKNAEILVAEDTRVLRKLLAVHKIELNGRQILLYHDHNSAGQRTKIIQLVKANKSAVLVSDAGTPLIADPGYKLVREAILNDIQINSVPGASALLSALILSGFPTNNFFFAGFVPSQKKAKRKFFSDLLGLNTTIIFYESPKRLNETLSILNKICQIDQQIAVCRELTKKYEQVKRGKIKFVMEYFISKDQIKGEIAVAMAPAKPSVPSKDEVEAALLLALEKETMKDAVSLVSKNLKVSRKTVYSQALILRNKT